jgi:F-type H+-transporting ATPase subunit epsilon
MEFVAVSPQKTIRIEVDKVTLPGCIGDFTVLRNHAPLMSILRKGKVTYSQNGKVEEMEIESGIAEILHNKITILTEQ